MTIAKLNGEMVTRATVVLPRCGIWTALVLVASTVVLSGAAKLEIADATYQGTILDGSPFAGSGWYRIVGGAGGWRQKIKADYYRSEAGVKLSAVVKDAADLAGETVLPFDEQRVGPAFVRPEAEAARTLDLLSENNWYVDEAGKTHIGLRETSTFPLAYTLLDKRTDRRTIYIATEDIKQVVPGLVIENLEAATVRHELGADGLRTFIHGTLGISPLDADLQGLLRIIQIATHSYWYHGQYEFTVRAIQTGYLDLDPVTSADGLPPLSNVPMRVGISGGRADPAIGSSALVSFVNGDPTRPIVDGYVGESGAGHQPQHVGIYGPDVNLGASGGPGVARKGDAVHGGFMLFDSGNRLIPGSTAPGVNGYYPATAAGWSSVQTDQSSNPGSIIVKFGGAITVDPATGGLGKITDGSGKVKAAT